MLVAFEVSITGTATNRNNRITVLLYGKVPLPDVPLPGLNLVEHHQNCTNHGIGGAECRFDWPSKPLARTPLSVMIIGRLRPELQAQTEYALTQRYQQLPLQDRKNS